MGNATKRVILRWIHLTFAIPIIGYVAVWLGAYQLLGMGPAILSLAGLLIARKIWLVIRARQSKGIA